MQVPTIKWEPGWMGCDSPWDYGWYRGTRGDAFFPDVYFDNRSDWDEYKDGYNEARKGWD